MEPLDGDYPTSQTNIINIENVECHTPSPLTSEGSNCSISFAKLVDTAEASIKERNDVMFRLMGHFITDSTGPEEGSDSNTDTTESSPAALKQRLHDLPPSSEAVKLADRVAALNRRIRKERDLYLHLQGLTNRIEEKDEAELSTTDSAKTSNPVSRSHYQTRIGDARARRRERLKFSTPMSCELHSPGLSSPEPLSITEIHENLSQKKTQSSFNEDHYSFKSNLETGCVERNILASPSILSMIEKFDVVGDMTSSRFSEESDMDRAHCNVVSNNSKKFKTVIDGSLQRYVTPDLNFDFENSYSKNRLNDCSQSPEVDTDRIHATPSSTNSLVEVDNACVTLKKPPMKFGGYRPVSGFIFRNLSSDSESDVTLDRIGHENLRSQDIRREDKTNMEDRDKQETKMQNDFSWNNYYHNTDETIEVESFSNERREVLRGRILSPILSVDSQLHIGESTSSQKHESHPDLQVQEEANWTSLPRDERKQNVLVDRLESRVDNDQLEEHGPTELFGNATDTQDRKNSTNTTDSENFPKLRPPTDVCLSKDNTKTNVLSFPSNQLTTQPVLASSSRDRRNLIFSDSDTGREDQKKSNSDVYTTSNRHPNSLPNSLRYFPKSIDGIKNLQNHDQSYSDQPLSPVQRSLTIVKSAKVRNCDSSDDNDVRPSIPPLEIESYEESRSQSPPAEVIEEMPTPSLDVNALIQALSDVSLNREISTNSTNRSTAHEKSPLGFYSRFSGSSCPRSSEYTPAAGGSRQSLTSLEVSEAQSLKTSRVESPAPWQTVPLLKSNEHSVKLMLRPSEGLDKLSIPNSNLKHLSKVGSMPLADRPLELDLTRTSSFIPVVAKVNKTNLVCTENELTDKSIVKIISPRKYPNTDISTETSKPLTSRTTASQSSEDSRKSFRSLKSVPLASKVHEKKIDSLRLKRDSISPLPPLSGGRRVLEPLTRIPKVQQDLPTDRNTKSNRRRKIANDLVEIIRAQPKTVIEKPVTKMPHKNSSRKSPMSRNERTELHNSRFSQCLQNSIAETGNSLNTSVESLVMQNEVSNGTKLLGKRFENGNRLSMEQKHKSVESTSGNQKYFSISNKQSSEISDITLYPPSGKSRNVRHCAGPIIRFTKSPSRSERLCSMSSGDYEENTSWSPLSREDDSARNCAPDVTGTPDDQRQLGSMDSNNTSKATDSGTQNMSPNRTAYSGVQNIAKPFGNCIRLDDLQDGREVTIASRDTSCRGEYSREKQLFMHLPNEISASLTRHSSFGTEVAGNVKSNKEMPNTIEDLRKNIEENNDKWIKSLKNDDDFENDLKVRLDFSAANALMASLPESCDLEKVSSTRSTTFGNGSKISHDIHFGNLNNGSVLPPRENANVVEGSCDETACVSEKIHYGSSKCLESVRESMRHESGYSRESSQLNSQRSSLMHSSPTSYQSTPRSIAKSKNSITVSTLNETLYQTTAAQYSVRQSVIEASTCNDETVENSAKQADLRQWNDHEVSSTSKKTNTMECSPSGIDAKCILNDESAVEAIPLNTGQIENHIAEFIPNLQCNVDDEQDEKQSVDLNNSQDTQLRCTEHQRPTKASMSRVRYSQSTRCSNKSPGVCERKASPSSTLTAKSEVVPQHHQDVTPSSPVPIRSFLSMPKLNLTGESRWDVGVVNGANNVKKSQDRFPFTISESASRKTSKFKVVADVSIDQLIQKQSASLERNVAMLTQQTTLGKLGGRINELANTEQKLEPDQRGRGRQLTPFPEEKRGTSNESLHNWNDKIPFDGVNYISYGCREEPRTLLPTVKGIVRKFSVRLGHTKTKRHRNSGDKKVKILYKNKKCRYESGEGSSSAASLYQSQIFTSKSSPGLVPDSTDGSRASSGRTVKPEKNKACTSLSMQSTPRKGCDHNDLWIQEFDSDVEFDGRTSPLARRLDPTRTALPPRNSPVDDRYSMFLARCNVTRMVNQVGNDREKIGSVYNCCESGDTHGSPDYVRMQKITSIFPNTFANSYDDESNEFRITDRDDNFEDSTAQNGCCCVRICHFFTKSSKHSAKPRRRILKFWNKK